MANLGTVIGGLSYGTDEEREYTMDDAVSGIHKHNRALKEVRHIHRLIIREVRQWPR